MPELKEDSVDIKAKYEFATGTILSTHRQWGEAKNPQDVSRRISEAVEEHEEKLEELAEFDKERWKELIEGKVVDDKQGHDKTLDQFKQHFEFTEAEIEWIQLWIEIYRKVRLDDMDVEEAERFVKHDMDSRQSNLVEEPQTQLGELPNE